MIVRPSLLMPPFCKRRHDRREIGDLTVMLILRDEQIEHQAVGEALDRISARGSG